MTTNQVVAEYERRASSGRAILMAAVFAIGTLAGIVAQGTLDRATERPALPQPAASIASDAASVAARPAADALRVIPRACPCPARDTMSDAAYAAMHPSLSPRRTLQMAPD
jgi:hypothetical protein